MRLLKFCYNHFRNGEKNTSYLLVSTRFVVVVVAVVILFFFCLFCFVFLLIEFKTTHNDVNFT